MTGPTSNPGDRRQEEPSTQPADLSPDAGLSGRPAPVSFDTYREIAQLVANSTGEAISVCRRPKEDPCSTTLPYQTMPAAEATEQGLEIVTTVVPTPPHSLVRDRLTLSLFQRPELSKPLAEVSRYFGTDSTPAAQPSEEAQRLDTLIEGLKGNDLHQLFSSIKEIGKPENQSDVDPDALRALTKNSLREKPEDKGGDGN